jgi:outer membrane protein
MSLSGGRNAARCVGVALIVVGASANAQWWHDPFKTEGMTTPAPHQRWESSTPLPIVSPTANAESLRTDQPLTLPELTEFGLRNNPRTRQAWFSARAAAAAVGIAKGDDLPTITGSFAFQRQRPVSGTSGVASPWYNRYGPAISFSYTLFDFGLGDDRTEAVEYRLLAANLAQNRVLQDVIFQIEQSYYQLIGTEALVRVNERSLKNVETALDAARRRRESGVATAGDVFRAETQVAQAQLVLTRSRGEFEKSRGALSTALGLPTNSSMRVQTLTAPPQVQPVVSSIAEFLERAKSTRPDLVAAEAQVRAAKASAEAASKVGLPSIELVGSYGINEYFPDRASTRPQSYMLNVRIPIFSGFKDTYQVRQAQAQAEQAEATRDVIYRQTQLEVWQAYQDLQTVTTSLKTTESQVRSAEQTAQAVLARYQGGFGTILDLITAQQDEANARTQQIQSYLDWYTVLARLNYTLGANNMIPATTEKKQ